MGHKFLESNFLIFLAIFSAFMIDGCAAGAANTPPPATAAKSSNAVSTGATIKIETNSPADTVRVFYKNLREKRFREAIFLTNLRPAIEGLTETELKEFAVDFEAVAKHVPAEIEINGEIVSGDIATVTARLPDEDLEKSEIQEVRLRRENGIWVILTVDETAEKLIKQEGKNYFYALRIETHHNEARTMLDRISKAQMVYAAQHGGTFAEIPALIEKNLLPSDVQSSESTGYLYAVTLTDNRTKYYSTATPALYGKSGKLSFLVVLNQKSSPILTSKDNNGKPMKN
ncbi:MAG: hypothetical protein H7070_12720 [Saprospiraceae bacterium]|nr:hypothetical protein [Pyrinomonadaceae bacterium]